MKLSCIAIVLVVSTAPAWASTTVTGGNIIDETWTPAGSPYVVEGDITIPLGSTLTIQPGTTIQFPGGDLQKSGLSTTQVEVTVKGALVVNGTAASPVTMSSATANGWYGIVVDTTATSVALDRLTVTNPYIGLTYKAAGNVMAGLGLRIEDAAYRGLDVEAGSPAFDGVVVLRSTSYNVYVGGTASLALTNCVAAGAANGFGIFVSTSATSTVSITNCTLDGNEEGVYNNSDGLSSVALTNSIVTNGSGAGVYYVTSVTYSDVWNYGTDYQGISAGAGCMSANPQYVAADDYHLQATSIAIDSGTNGPDHDADDHARPADGDGINGPAWDMGAYEAGSTVISPGDAGVSDGGSPDGLPFDDAGGLGDGHVGSDPANPDGGLPGDHAPAGGGCCDAGPHGAGAGALLWICVAGLALARRRRLGAAR